ncbi:hypothetical protein FOL47_010029, partial [Perkinsus chesapeaki]
TNGSPSSVVDDHIGCVSLPWAPLVVDFLNSLDPAGDWDRDMVEFIYCYWFDEFDTDEVLPVNPGEHLLLTPTDLGLDKRRTLDAWVAAEIVSVEETSSIVRQKKYKSQTIKCRICDENIYNLIIRKRPEMRAEDGLLVKENFIYEKREGTRAEIYLRLKKELKHVDVETYRTWLEKREVPLSSEEEVEAKKRKKNSTAGRNRRRARGDSSVTGRSRGGSISSPITSRTNSPSSKTASPSLSPESPEAVQTASASPSPDDTIESRVRRSSRRGEKRSDAELAKLIQDNLLQDNSSYGRYYKLKRLREEGGGPPEPPPTPASPGKQPIRAAAPVGGGKLLEVHEAVREAVASVEVIPEVSEEREPSANVAKKKGRASSSKSSGGNKRPRSEGSKSESMPVEDPRELTEKRARTFLSQPVVDRDYVSRLETVLPVNRVRQRQKAAEGFASAIERGVRSNGKTHVDDFCREAGELLEDKIFVNAGGITEAGWSKYVWGKERLSLRKSAFCDRGGILETELLCAIPEKEAELKLLNSPG